LTIGDDWLKKNAEAAARRAQILGRKGKQCLAITRQTNMLEIGLTSIYPVFPWTAKGNAWTISVQSGSILGLETQRVLFLLI
jgi:hypothetical protein